MNNLLVADNNLIGVSHKKWP